MSVSCTAGAGAILSVGLLKMIGWEKMAKRFDIDGGVSGGQQIFLYNNGNLQILQKLLQ